MPLLTTVIDDKSPLIVYDPSWLPGTSQDDPLATSYYLGTFTTNNVTDGLVTLSFNGTAIWIYGAKRSNHGSYTVQLDGATYSGLNGNGNNLFLQSLFNTSFSQAMHTVKLTNTATGSLYVDIDMIVWQSEVGSTDDQLVAEVVQDTDSRFQYQEPAWDTTSSTFNFNLFANGTGHVTNTYNASVAFTFTVGYYSLKSIISDLRIITGHAYCSAHRYAALTDLSGEAVTIFGTSGPSNGQYSVQLDGSSSVTYNATNGYPGYPTNYGVVIYHADNLGSGSHQLVLTNLPGGSSQSLLGVDYAQLWTIANTTTTTTTTASGTTSSQNPSSGNLTSTSQNNLSSGAIAGIVVAVVAAVLGAGAAVFFYRRWRAALATHHNLYRIYTPQERPPESATVAPTGFSSSLETRGNASLLRSDTSIQALAGMAQQPVNNHAAQYDGAFSTSPGSRDSRGFIDTVSSPTQSPEDEGLGRRPLPDAPGGGLPLTAEFPKLASSRRGQSVITDDRTSIAVSEVPPPNYNQATGNAATRHE